MRYALMLPCEQTKMVMPASTEGVLDSGEVLPGTSGDLLLGYSAVRRDKDHALWVGHCTI
jgi:hypothetical protein